MVTSGHIIGFELKRLVRCKVIACCVGAFVLYGIAALVFLTQAAARPGVTAGNAALYIEGMLCCQLSVFTIGVLAVYCFANVTANGEHLFLEQMGVPLKKVVWARLALLSIVCTLSIVLLFSITALCLSTEMQTLISVAAISVISVLDTILLGCLIGYISKNGFVGAFAIFAVAIVSSFINTAVSGLFLQFDSNSLTAQTLSFLTGWEQQSICVFGFDLSSVALPLALSLELVWLVVLVALVWVALRRGSRLN